MKNLTLICFASILLSMACSKKNEEPSTVLPDATQIGANTFGAFTNGTLLLPRSIRIKSADMVAYYNPTAISPSVNFNIYADDEVVDPIRTIQIISKTPLQQGQNYSLQVSPTNPVSATYTGNLEYNVIAPLTGMLNITKLDTQNQIMSGTFYFDAIDSKGEKVSVTDGRFDVKF